MPDVFISYSRELESDLVDRLSAALAERGQEAWIDRADIFPSSRWRPEIEQAILESHAFVFAISPDSVTSPYCRAELDHAVALGKRIIPILARATDMASVPDELAALHFLSFTEWHDAGQGSPEGFRHQVDRLVEVLSTDVEALHLHTRLLTQSNRWIEHNEDRSLLLRGRELETAEQWLDEQTAARRAVLPEQQRLIRQSRRAASRRQRGSVGVSLVVAVAMALLAVAAVVQRAQAVHQASISLAGDLAAESIGASATNVTTQGLLGIEAYSRSATEQARSALVAAVEQPLVATFHTTLGEVNGVAYDPSQRLLAVAYEDGVALWDTDTDKMQGRPFDVGQHVNGVAFSRDGDEIAAAQNGAVELFATSTHHEDRRLPGDRSAMTAVAFSPVADLVAGVSDDGGIYIWNLATGQSVHASISGKGNLLSVAFSPSGSQIAISGALDLSAGGTNGFVYELPLTLNSVLEFPDIRASIGHVAFSSNGGTIAAADDNGHVFLLNSANLTKSGEVRVQGASYVLAFSPNGQSFATGDAQGAVQIWNASSLNQVGPTMQDGSIVYGLAFSPDGRSLASGDFAGDTVVWSTNGRLPQARSLPGDNALQLSINRTSTLLATANEDGSVDVWTVASHKLLVHLPGNNGLTAAVFSPHDPTSLALGEADGNVALYDVRSGRSELLPGSHSVVNLVAFSADGNELAVGYASGRISLWNLGHRTEVGRFPIPRANAGGVTALAFNADGEELAAAYENYGIELFHPDAPRDRGVPLRLNEAAYGVAFSTDGTVLAVGDNAGNVELFDVANRTSIGSLPGDGNTIYGLAISPDDSTLATVDLAGSVHLWDLATRLQLGSSLETGLVGLGLGFAPDGAYLATAGENGPTVLWPSLLWQNDFSALRGNLCPRLAQNLDPTQWRQDVPGQTYQTVCPGYPDEN